MFSNFLSIWRMRKMLGQSEKHSLATREDACKTLTRKRAWCILFILFSHSICSPLLAATIDGSLDREGRAWSEKTATGVEAEETGGWAVISGGGEAFYYFYLPYTA
jgi:hypothetical protein